MGKTQPRPSSAMVPPPAEINQLAVLFNTGRHAELENLTRTLLGKYPNAGVIWKLLGLSLQIQGKEALPAFQKAVELLPDDAEAHNNLGTALDDLERFDEAMASYRQALKLRPGYAEAHSNLGNTLKDLGQFDEAITCYRRALEIKPDSPAAHYSLGNAFKDAGQFDEAITCYRRALELSPGFATAHNNLGIALQAVNKFDPAIASFRRSLEIDPGFAAAHNNLGGILGELGQFDDAVTCYRRALAILPDYAEAHGNLANALKDIGKLNEAVASYRRALEIKPDFLQARSNLLFSLSYASNPDPQACLEEARQYGRMVAKYADSRFTAWQCTDRPTCLRVGMVSGDLNHHHPVGLFLEGLLAHIDPKQIELIAYPSLLEDDTLTARIKSRFATWKPLTGLNDQAAAQLIHADGVHVLIDLSGHTAHNRLPLFAWKPAPVQAAWLGYFATTGMTEMDYLIADRAGVPDEQQKNFTETVWYLPDTRLCFSPPEVDQPVTPLPALNNGHITFGCFQNLTKVNDDVLQAWANILSALPDARLRWQSKQLGDPVVAEQVVSRLQQHGMDTARITLLGAVSREAYLAAHGEVDILLDTFPFPGGTTTCEALWMGVPTLTLAGNSLLARQGASLLTAAGLEDWITTGVGDYVDRAIALSNDLTRLTTLRAGLRKQVITSSLFDAPRFARSFEAALWGMWRAKGELALHPQEPGWV